ncbi:hypothetical protein [Phaeobacter sp. HF9A]|uniref:hypothetical protein n=1 Tax=Phaeobacter sp. HF9A TaxID=2721561 RepID=UPI001430B575|nr:hypothetical protein [Phaeobacter sp. HF9A]NIZ12090.1 hypothetical protein [Phaeobacter sp. HF9A]
MSTTAERAAQPILILTPHAMEAADISDYLIRRGYPIVISELQLNGIMSPMEDTTMPPPVVFFGFQVNQTAARQWLDAALARDWPVVLVNGDTTEAEYQGLLMLSRPFDTAHLDAIMDRLEQSPVFAPG